MALVLHSHAEMPLALARRDRPAGRSPTSTSPTPPIHETDLDRIIKLIPAELIAFYTAAAPLVSDVPWPYFPFAIFATGSVLVSVILYLDGQSTAQLPHWSQYVVRTLTFMAWAMAMRWPFEPWTSSHDLRWARSLAVLVVPFLGAFALRQRSIESTAP